MPIGTLAAGVMASAALVVLVLGWSWPLGSIGHELFAVHMLQHLLAMNVAAPLLALAAGPSGRGAPWELAVMTASQLAGLWLWHMPLSFAATHDSPALDALMKGSMFGLAWLFWRAVLAHRARPIWPALLALLITAKGFCLLGAALIFARHPLYPTVGNPQKWGLTPLDDQQLAGLFMVSTCALIYVSAATALFAAWLFATGSRRNGVRHAGIAAG